MHRIIPLNFWKRCENNLPPKFHVPLMQSKYQTTTLNLMEADTGLLFAMGTYTSAHEAAKVLRI